MEISALHLHVSYAQHQLLVVVLVKIILQLLLNEIPHDYPVESDVSPRQYLLAQEFFLCKLVNELVCLNLCRADLRQRCNLSVRFLLLFLLYQLFVDLLLLVHIRDIQGLLSGSSFLLTWWRLWNRVVGLPIY